MSSAADPWAAAAQQYKAGGGSAATAPTEPDWKIWTQGDSSTTAPPPSYAQPPSWLPQSMQKFIGQVDTSRYEKAQQQGWQPFQQIGQGVKTAVTGPDMQARAGGAHQALTGAMDVGAHLLPAIAPINPLGTAAGIAAGTVAGMGTSAGLKAAGIPEEYSNLGGDVAGIVAGGLAGKGVSRLTGGGLVGADPETLTWQALQPRGGSGAHYNNAPVVMGDIKASAIRRGLPIRSARELKGAIDSAELDNRDAFGQHWAQVQNRIPLDHVADLIDQTLDPETRRLASLGDPEAQAHVDAVHNYANTFRGQSVTPDEFRALQEHVNAEDDVFQKKSDEKQAKIIAARGGDPTIRAKATAYRDIVRQVAGDDAADIQTRYGLLRDWNAAAQKAMDKALMEKAGTAMQKGAQMADVPGQIATGQLEKTPPLKGTTDQKIRWAFDKFQPGPTWKPIRLPQAMSGNQIPPSPRMGAPPPDTSFVRKGPSPFGSERGSFSNRPSSVSVPDAIKGLESGPGNYVDIPSLRQALGSNADQKIWQAVRDAKGGLVLAEHSGPAEEYGGSTPNSDLLIDNQGRRYIGIARARSGMFGSERGSWSNRPSPQPPASSGLKVGDRVAYKNDPLSIATIRNIGKTKATIEDAVAKRTVPIENLVPKPLEQDMIEYYRQRPEEIKQAMPDVVEHLPPDVLALAKAPQESVAKQTARMIWNAIKPKVPAEQDIDFQQRFGEKEQPEVAKFLGYDNPERGGSGVVQVDPRQLIPTEPPELLHPEAIERQRQMFRQGSTPPPIKIFYDENGQPTISGGAGHHRRAAAILEGVPTIPAQVIDPSEARIMPAEARQQAVSRARDWGDIGAGLNAEEKAAIGIGKEK